MAESDQKIGDYLIVDKIAQGGMAQIYKAKTADPGGIERFVVIKRILPHISSNPEYVDMLIDEAKIAVHFNHGNIAQIYDLGKVGEDYFIVMEYVDGKTLGQILREFTERGEFVPIEIAVYCLMETCRGLDYMHGRTDAEGKPLGVVHRDISPQNIIVSYSGTVKIIDFGVAKAMEKTSHTESGVLKGKFAYMSPEQANGDSIDRRSDIFSAGILLWEFLTRERLFKRKSNLETVKAVRRAHVQVASRLRKDIPKELDRIIEKALSRKPGKRYQQASDMAEDLSRFLMQFKPDFRPLHVAQFLYKYFGPEADEAGLEPELPELKIEKKPSPISDPTAKRKLIPEDEEITEIEKQSRFAIVLPWRKIAVGSTLVLVSTLGAATFYYRYPSFHMGDLELTVLPADAEVYVDDQYLPKQYEVYKIRHTAIKPVTITVSYPKYLPYTNTLQLSKNKKEVLKIELRRDIPPFGDVMVESNPPGALIYLDDAQWNKPTPATIPHLKSEREYRVGVFLEGYRFAEKKVKVSGLKPDVLQYNLEVDYATLEIHSQPPGANVTMDEQIIGQTPFVSRSIKPNAPFDFDLRLEGYEETRQSITLKPGEKKLMEFNLNKKQL